MGFVRLMKGTAEHVLNEPGMKGLRAAAAPAFSGRSSGCSSIHLSDPDTLLCHLVCEVEDKQLVKAGASSHSERVINGRAAWGRALMTIDLSCGLQRDGSTLMHSSSCESQRCSTSPGNSPSACRPPGFVRARLQRFTPAASASSF